MIMQLLQKANKVLGSSKKEPREVPLVAYDLPPPIALDAARRARTDAPSGGQDKLDLIVVPQSALDAMPDDPRALIDAVVGYVSYLLHEAHFAPDEIPAEAMQVYRCDDYHAHVCNGGHAHFVVNNAVALRSSINDLMAGLIGTGEPEYQRIAREMAAFVSTNTHTPLARMRMDDPKLEVLKKLDQPFYIHDKTTRFTQVLADWISGFEILLSVPDDMLKSVYKGIAKLNVRATTRQTASRIAQFSCMLDDPKKLGFGLAGGGVKDPIIGFGGSLRMDVNGQMVPATLIYAAKGECWGVIDDEGAALRAQVVDEDSETARVGEVLSRVSYEEIETARASCLDLNAAAAIDLLVARYDPELEVDFLSVHQLTDPAPESDCLMIYAVASGGKAALLARIEPDGAELLLEPTHEIKAQVSRLEIEQHAAAKMGNSVAA